MSNALAIARAAMLDEAEAITAAAERLDAHTIERAVLTIRLCRGHLIVTGVGKSGHVARKIAATFSSTGVPAAFLHAGDASHGDLGMISGYDVVLAISNSGETAELVALLPSLKRYGVKLLAIVGRANSTLAMAADVVLDASVEREACPLGLAPSASTAVQMALGDALAFAVMAEKGVTEAEFARCHPGGAIGKRLAAVA